MIALLVERDWDTREVVKQKLQRRGFTVHTAETAEEALNLCVVFDADLIVTAAVLPEMSGFTLIDRIRQGRKDLELSAIVLLGKDEHPPKSLQALSALPALLNKPVQEEKLAECLAQGRLRALDAGS